MHRRTFAYVAFVFAFLGALVTSTAPAPAMQTHLQHIYYIMMENQSFDEVIGRHKAGEYGPYTKNTFDTPFITSLLLKYGVNTLNFGTTHPSLPNYLSTIAGDYYGIQDDNASCYAQPAATPCDKVTGMNIADQLEAKGMTWATLQQSMPSVGYLGTQYPTGTNAPTHYAQKHNPFVYYKQIATNPTRLKNVIPLKTMADLKANLSRNFLFIVPDECHDMHGSSDCSNYDALLMEGDKYVKDLVTTIMTSPEWKTGSAIILTWDEDDYSSNLGCCGSIFNDAGGHTAMIVMTPGYKAPMWVASPSNHYDELSSIEAEFGLSKLGKAALEPPTLMQLFL
jgi:phospholipase C